RKAANGSCNGLIAIGTAGAVVQNAAQAMFFQRARLKIETQVSLSDGSTLPVPASLCCACAGVAGAGQFALPYAARVAEDDAALLSAPAGLQPLAGGRAIEAAEPYTGLGGRRHDGPVRDADAGGSGRGEVRYAIGHALHCDEAEDDAGDSRAVPYSAQPVRGSAAGRGWARAAAQCEAGRYHPAECVDRLLAGAAGGDAATGRELFWFYLW